MIRWSISGCTSFGDSKIKSHAYFSWLNNCFKINILLKNLILILPCNHLIKPNFPNWKFQKMLNWVNCQKKILISVHMLINYLLAVKNYRCMKLIPWNNQLIINQFSIHSYLWHQFLIFNYFWLIINEK